MMSFAQAIPALQGMGLMCCGLSTLCAEGCDTHNSSGWGNPSVATFLPTAG